MQAAGDSNIDTKIEIQNELMSINAVVTKIKQELHEINNIVQTNGSLDSALENAIVSLLLLVQETGVVVEERPNITDEENSMTNALSRITAGYLTEKLKALCHDSQSD